MRSRLGSGTRKLYKYVKFYSGKDPMLIEGDFFRTIVPLDDDHSFDANIGHIKEPTIDLSGLTETESKVYQAVCTGTTTTLDEISALTGINKRTVRRTIGILGEKGLITRTGGRKIGKWVQK